MTQFPPPRDSVRRSGWISALIGVITGMMLISSLTIGDRGSSLIPEGLGSTFGGAVPSKAGVGSVSLGMGLCGPFPSPSTVCSLRYIFSTLIVYSYFLSPNLEVPTRELLNKSRKCKLRKPQAVILPRTADFSAFPVDLR